MIAHLLNNNISRCQTAILWTSQFDRFHNSLPTCTVVLHAFWRLLAFFFNLTFSNYSLRNTIRVSNSLDQDQARCFVGPELGPNCLQM